MRIPSLVGVLVLVCPCASAQLQWTLGPSGPVARSVTALVPDHAGGGLLLFGGDGAPNDTWRWQAGAWQQLSPAVSPPARYGPKMASDSARQRVVLFGGNATGLLAPLGDTWEWDGAQWNQMSPPGSPPARGGHCMTFDRFRARTVMFGGNATIILPVFSSVSFRDTWLWDGTQWTQLSLAVQPPSLINPEMVFDDSRGCVVMTGGVGATWEWDGTNWTQHAGGLPAPGGAMVYDQARQRVVWHGGTDPNGNALPIGVFEYDGVSWTSRATTTPPPIRYWHVMTFDAALDKVVMFGGRDRQWRFGDTWFLAPVHPATVGVFGQGCAGSGGQLQLRAETRPWLGDQLRLRWTNLPATSLVALVMGFSNQSWGSAPLPLPLTGFGGPASCFLYVSVDATLTMVTTGGVLVTSHAVPTNPALLGMDVFLQGAAFDTGPLPGPMAVSNGVSARIGAR